MSEFSIIETPRDIAGAFPWLAGALEACADVLARHIGDDPKAAEALRIVFDARVRMGGLENLRNG